MADRLDHQSDQARIFVGYVKIIFYSVVRMEEMDHAMHIILINNRDIMMRWQQGNRLHRKPLSHPQTFKSWCR